MEWALALLLAFLLSGKYVALINAHGVSLFCTLGAILRNSLLFFVLVLIAASQISCNLEGKIKSIFRKTGSTVDISCDIKQSATYIHWYFFPENMAPRRLLYYETSYSKKEFDSGTRADKYDASKITDKSFKLHLKRLEASDSGVYYCAVWVGHSDSDLLYATLKTLLVAAPGTQYRLAPVSLPALTSLNSVQT